MYYNIPENGNIADNLEHLESQADPMDHKVHYPREISALSAAHVAWMGYANDSVFVVMF